MVQRPPLCFGDCVIDVPARTVLRGGRPQAFEPKVLDALVYLIEHRERVVPKQELLEQVWGQRVVVSEGVIARTIMKVRRLLGDNADEPSLVKTVHRIGYRFAGHVTHGNARAADGAGHPAAARTRVAVLPFVNDTGSEALSWVELGLMTATSRALHEAGVEVAAAAEVLAAVEAAGDRADAAAAVASDVVAATLGRRDGALVLAWTGHGRALDALDGELSGSDPIEICRRFASQLLLQLVPGRSAPAAVHDPYVEVVRTRAAEAIAGERWESARRLLQVAADEAPGDDALQLDLARCLVEVRDAGAQRLLERLHGVAKAGADDALERECLRLLARCEHAAGHDAEAERLLSRALSLAEAAGDRRAELQLLQAMGDLAANRGRGAIADWLLDRAAALAQTLGDPAAIARSLDARGRVAAACGDRDAAMRHFEDALQMQQTCGAQAAAAHTLRHLGDLHGAYGRIGTARQFFAAAFDKALTSGDPAAIAIGGLNVGRYAGIAIGRDDFAAGIVERLRTLDSRGRVVIESCADLLDAKLHARAGRLAECLQLLDRADGGYAKRNFGLRIGRYRAQVLVASGFVEEARDASQAFLDEVPSVQRSLAGPLAQHMVAICEHAAGRAAAALTHVRAAIASAPPSLARLDMTLDAAWLQLDAGDRAGAERSLDACRAEFDTALADEYGPALMLRALQHDRAGEPEAAAAMRGRCRLPPATTFAWHRLPARLRFVPSMLDVAPALVELRSRARAAA